MSEVTGTAQQSDQATTRQETPLCENSAGTAYDSQVGQSDYYTPAIEHFDTAATQIPSQHGTRMRQKTASGTIDEALLRKSQEILSSIDLQDPLRMQLDLSALAGTIAEMWETAPSDSDPHLDVLAAADNAALVLSDNGSANEEQVSALREALSCLAQRVLVPSSAEIVRTRLLEARIGPLAFLDDDRD